MPTRNLPVLYRSRIRLSHILEFDLVFREIKNYPGYEIDKRGTVRRSATGRIIKNWKDASGLMAVSLQHPYGISCQEFVHKLLWKAFKGEIPKGLYVHFKNNNPDDIRLTNLELGTRRGGANPQPRYDVDFARIFKQRRDGVPIKDIASGSKISPNYVKAILYGPIFAPRRRDFEAGLAQKPRNHGKGRAPILSSKEMAAVRILASNGVSRRGLAEAFQVSPQTISNCVRRTNKCYAA